MKTIYRVSDNGYKKPKLPGADHFGCMNNFVATFGFIDHVIFDNCSDLTVKKLSKFCRNQHRTALGNAESFLYALDIALDQDDEIVYMVEDDYLHKPDSAHAISEGLSISDYVTLYDHPDKYGKMYGMGETCKLMRLNHRHWKTSVSTTMTFASRRETLRKDQHVFREVCSGKFHPNDHEIFTNLGDMGRRLIVSIPGMSFHADISSQILNLDNSGGEIDVWAMRLMERRLANNIYKTNDGDLVEKMEEALNSSEGLPLLHRLEQIYDQRVRTSLED